MNNKRNEDELTYRIYETQSFVSEFDAEVIDCQKLSEDNLYGIVLDKTAFFPEGGGQQSDTGTLGAGKVYDVQLDDNGKIIHYVSSPKEFIIGENIKGKVDFEKRFVRMQNHSAEHIVSGLVHKEYGYENVGFHMSEDSVRFDFDGAVSLEQMLEIEKKANECVYSNVPIVISFPTKEELPGIEYRSKLDIDEGVRLVSIGDVDVCACCAPHVDYTGQIGLIKIIDVMPHRQGTRVTMIAGQTALSDYNMLHKENAEIMAFLSAKREETAKGISDMMIRNQKLKEENTNLKRELTNIISKSFIDRIKSEDLEIAMPQVIFSSVLDNVGMRNLINEAVKIYKGAVVGFIGENGDYRYIIGCENDELNIKDISEGLNEKFSGKGGGSKKMIQGSLVGKEKDIKEYVENLRLKA